MSLDRSGEKLQRFKSALPMPDEDGDIYYDAIDFEDTFESLRIKNDNQTLKLGSKDKEDKYDLNMSLGDREMATKTKEAHSNDKEIKPTEIRKSIINCLGYLIKIMRETLSTEDMDEIIQEDVNCDGNEILNEDLDLREEPIFIDFSKLLEIMARKLWGFQLSIHNDGTLELGKNDNVTVQHLRTILTSLGTVMISLGQTISDEEFGQITKRDSSDGNSDFSKLICNMIEKEIKESDFNVDIIRDFGVFDPRGTGYVYVDELREAMMSTGDMFGQREMIEFLEDMEVNEQGQFNYVDYVTKVSMKRSQKKYNFS
ncbi:uncharacterized protein LOC111642014 [Centruroides sculpturatus]|uniref:uncharacterized protein LOC111642014 n=1 Tax=Centruroides sculpturatus TaxID=218467 RepID=UPI000C6C956A|nr:uncharacterized protein LOC111642014 [Centruroides sculpturatus]